MIIIVLLNVIIRLLQALKTAKYNKIWSNSSFGLLRIYAFNSFCYLHTNNYLLHNNLLDIAQLLLDRLINHIILFSIINHKSSHSQAIGVIFWTDPRSRNLKFQKCMWSKSNLKLIFHIIFENKFVYSWIMKYFIEISRQHF